MSQLRDSGIAISGNWLIRALARMDRPTAMSAFSQTADCAVSVHPCISHAKISASTVGARAAAAVNQPAQRHLSPCPSLLAALCFAFVGHANQFLAPASAVSETFLRSRLSCVPEGIAPSIDPAAAEPTTQSHQ